MNLYSRFIIFFSLLTFLFFSTKIYAQTKIIKTGDTWFYFDKSNTPPVNWEKSNESISEWQEGISPLGYGDSYNKTNISFGDDPENKHITKYFKKIFRLENPYDFLVYSLNVVRDDGVVIYLNGREVMRNNMPGGEILSTTEASSLVVSSEAETYVHKKLLLPDDFVAGVNTLSVSVHKARKTSIDCIFTLELIGDNDSKMIPFLIEERSIKNLTIEAKLKEQNYEQQLKNKDLNFQILEQSKSNHKVVIYILIFLLILLIVTIFYINKNWTNKNRKLENDLSDLKEQNVNKDKSMITSSLHLLNNQQLLKDLKNDLENSIDKDANSLRAQTKKLINQIEYNIGTNDDWENLKKHFNAVHSGYYDKLVKLHPNLSEVELRHCIFIKLYMQTKEIASILHIDPKSVQASRYRIKKKLELDEEVDLRDYLLNI